MHRRFDDRYMAIYSHAASQSTRRAAAIDLFLCHKPSFTLVGYRTSTSFDAPYETELAYTNVCDTVFDEQATGASTLTAKYRRLSSNVVEVDAAFVVGPTTNPNDRTDVRLIISYLWSVLEHLEAHGSLVEYGLGGIFSQSRILGRKGVQKQEAPLLP